MAVSYRHGIPELKKKKRKEKENETHFIAGKITRELQLKQF